MTVLDFTSSGVRGSFSRLRVCEVGLRFRITTGRLSGASGHVRRTAEEPGLFREPCHPHSGGSEDVLLKHNGGSNCEVSRTSQPTLLHSYFLFYGKMCVTFKNVNTLKRILPRIVKLKGETRESTASGRVFSLLSAAQGKGVS